MPDRNAVAMNPAEAKRGTLLAVTSGTYSDYNVMGFFVALQSFSPETQLSQYLDANPDQFEQYRFKEDQFLQHLINAGLLLEIQFGELHLTDYSSHKELSWTPLTERE